MRGAPFGPSTITVLKFCKRCTSHLLHCLSIYLPTSITDLGSDLQGGGTQYNYLELASFPGHYKNGLATSACEFKLYTDVTSQQFHYLIQAVNIKSVLVSHDFYS